MRNWFKVETAPIGKRLIAIGWGQKLFLWIEGGEQLVSMNVPFPITSISSLEQKTIIEGSSSTLELIAITCDRLVVICELSSENSNLEWKRKSTYLFGKALSHVRIVNKDRFLVADKFGNVMDLSIEKMNQISKSNIRRAVLKFNPKDKNSNETMAKRLQYLNPLPPQEDLENPPPPQNLENQDLTWIGQLCTITDMVVAGNYVYIGDRDEKLRIVRKEALYDTVAICCGHSEFVISIFPLVKRKKVLTTSGDGTVKLWDIEKAECLATLTLDGGVGYCGGLKEGETDEEDDELFLAVQDFKEKENEQPITPAHNIFYLYQLKVKGREIALVKKEKVAFEIVAFLSLPRPPVVLDSEGNIRRVWDNVIGQLEIGSKDFKGQPIAADYWKDNQNLRKRTRLLE